MSEKIFRVEVPQKTITQVKGGKKTEKEERLKLQTEAITLCDELSCFVQISMDLNLIGSETVEYWQKKISDIKYMTIAWRSKDKAR